MPLQVHYLYVGASVPLVQAGTSVDARAYINPITSPSAHLSPNGELPDVRPLLIDLRQVLARSR
jgi:hypothetical protein